MTKNKILIYLCVVAGVTIGLYTLTHTLGFLGSKYFAEHQKQLTMTEDFYGAGVTNYYYLKTPYDYFVPWVGLVSLLAPIILVLVLSIKLMLQKYTKKQYLFALLLPIIYGMINTVFFFATMNKSLGWEYEIGMVLTFFESCFVFVLVVIINSIIFWKHKKFENVEKIDKFL
ncbi:MAG TPA: hypothetical protein DEB09_03940 [Candidatus Magasanikbacteria bacterium]|nr:hypothetical protein [Candidatus Magasanikbacteria bacterium]